VFQALLLFEDELEIAIEFPKRGNNFPARCNCAFS
jgi:hypothetical protein